MTADDQGVALEPAGAIGHGHAVASSRSGPRQCINAPPSSGSAARFPRTYGLCGRGRERSGCRFCSKMLIAAENGVGADAGVQHIFHRRLHSLLAYGLVALGVAVFSMVSITRFDRVLALCCGVRPAVPLLLRLLPLEIAEVRSEPAQRRPNFAKLAAGGTHNELVAAPQDLDLHVNACEGESLGNAHRLASRS